MFETVNKAGARSGKRLTEGVVTSILVHVGLIIVIVAVSSSDSKSNQKKEIDYSKVTFKDAPEPPPPPPPPPEANLPPPPPPPPPPPAAAAVVPDQQPKIPKKPKKPAPAAQPNTVVTAPVDPNPAAPEPVAGGQVGGVEGGVVGGVVGGKIGGVEGGVVGGTGTVPSNAVLPFGSGMDRPRKVSGRDPEYSREALAAGVEGMMIVRCVIELDGKLQDCKVLKTLPYMEESVLSALATHRYTPVMFQGRPQRVNYTFNIKLMAKQ